MLLKDEQWLRQTRISSCKLLAQNSDLRMLTPQAENCCPSDIRMMNVSGDQAAKIVGILFGSSATTFVEEELEFSGR